MKTISKKPRKKISQKNRFEVFKRDAFSCQYCGKSAPNVILEVDHIKPISKGGDNNIINLVTSCFDCNRGKGSKELGDKSVITKQHTHLKELNEKRKQLEMMVEWREDLSNLTNDKIDIIANYINSRSSEYCVSDHGKISIKKWIKRYSVDQVLDAVEISFDQYLEISWEKAFKYIPRIISVKIKQTKNPNLKKLYYIRAILRNRGCVNEYAVMKLMNDAVDYNVDMESLQKLSKECRNWTEFKNGVNQFIDSRGDNA